VFNKEQVTLYDLEKNSNYEHLRAIVKYSCNHIHAGPRSIFTKLGLEDTSEAMLAGPSDIGFEDPLQNTSLSLVESIKALLVNLPDKSMSGIDISVFVRLFELWHHSLLDEMSEAGDL
jgi:hypothetical protein